MVAGKRRNRRDYSILLRCYGKTVRERFEERKCRKFAVVALILHDRGLRIDQTLFDVAIIALTRAVHISRGIEIHNPIFQRTNLRLQDFEDWELYDMRITERINFVKIFRALQFPEVLVADNGTKCNSEEALLMWFYAVSMPKKLVMLMKKFGIVTYSYCNLFTSDAYSMT